MKKFFALYRVPGEVMADWMKNTTPEEIKTQMAKMETDMNAWMQKYEKSIVDKGQPLGKTKRLTANGVEDVKNDLNYYTIVEAESHEAAVEMFKDSPHMSIPSSFVDIMEIPHMGM